MLHRTGVLEHFVRSNQNQKTFYTSHQTNPKCNNTCPQQKAWNYFLNKLSEHAPCSVLWKPLEGGRRLPDSQAPTKNGKQLDYECDQEHSSHPNYYLQLLLRHSVHLSWNSCALLPEKFGIIFKVAAVKLYPVLGFYLVFCFCFRKTISLKIFKRMVTDFKSHSCN